MTTQGLIAGWIVGSIAVAIISENRGYGFFQGLIMALVFSPPIGMVGVMLHTEDYDRKKKQAKEPIKPDGYLKPGERIPHSTDTGASIEIYRLSLLKDRGILTQQEFETQKAKIING